MNYAEFDQNGNLKNRLIKGLHVIPVGAVEVDDALWLRLTQETDGVWHLQGDGKIVKLPATQTRPDYLVLIADVRYRHEIGGITLAGMAIDTDDRSKTLISGSALKAMRDPDYVLRWKTPAGFVDLPAAQVLMIADAVSDHVQACFNRESALLDALESGTFNEKMLNEGWPE
ncbi:DUF4376 domain-containing protein [Pseudomonas prosekii]|uniref:DUF4376 domain-containing protein n=1 Tax=Pseudomonas prosekii TaxID=1148509 RepID=UPI0015E807EA|nr:DUF4376 domain-containing protein [Pseudomonas prosekii]